MFADKAEIAIKAGDGGNGLVSFRREIYVPAGGPDGGDGGKGGDIVFIIDPEVNTLADFKFKRKYFAQNGEGGKAKKCFGKNGEDLIIGVPEGTIVKDTKSGKIIADMTGENKRVVVAKGGKGGFGNTHFATPVRQAPEFAKGGIKAPEQTVSLELKLIADVGLVGFPNVGKSTLLSSVTQARPKIANYHFTTLEPNLGVVFLGPGRSFVMADIPGIIEGAHEGLGLGHDFLRHIERTRIIVHVVDVSGCEGRNPIEDFETINRELSLFSPQLASLNQVVAANKTDIVNDESLKKDFEKYVKAKGYPYFEISAATKSGVTALMNYLESELKKLPPVPIYESEVVYSEEDNDEPDFVVFREEDGTLAVEGSYIDKLLSSVNFENDESAAFFQRALRKKGIIDELVKMGVKEGDPVRVNDIEFDYMD
ncbi:MAG: GTPase ObgE [Bacillota bacterium]|nr:GTPase ObgE [Bacillota bacterium]